MENRRAETGTTQFDDDWPGIFIRGDNALYLSMALNNFLAGSQDVITRMSVKSLADMLARANVRHPEHRVDQYATVVRRAEPIPGARPITETEKTEEKEKTDGTR